MNCNSCGEAFGCKLSRDCWCYKYPRIIQTVADERCLCPCCLLKKIAQEVNHAAFIPTVQDRKWIADLGLSKMPELNIDYYINEDSNFVFTKWYHLKRGYCCENACKHCPYK